MTARERKTRDEWCAEYVKARDHARLLEAALREAMEWNWGDAERLDIPDSVHKQIHEALHFNGSQSDGEADG
jgi:hypothetical protein